MASNNTFDQYEEQSSENKTDLDQTKQNQCDDLYDDGTPVNKTSNPHKQHFVIDEPARKTGKL